MTIVRLARLRQLALATFALGAALMLVLPACRRDAAPAAPAVKETARATPVHAISPSAECRTCHEEIYKAWSESHHAFAHRPTDATSDAAAFSTERDFSLHGVGYKVGTENNRPYLVEMRPGRPVEKFVPAFTLAYKPLQQYVVPVGGGRYQMTELAWDPARHEWFNVFGDERRQPGEWGHWLGRGMNWNSMCAHCHMTNFRKNYDVARDTYDSTWLEHGVGCVQCHGNLPADHNDPKRRALVGLPSQKPPRTPEETAAARKHAQETCAPCHARNELLAGHLQPNAAYHDFYRLTLPTDAAVFYPDGQVRDEDFNYTSLLTSRMGGKAGVTCLDCHDPHTGRTLLPAQNNAICMQCHTAPGRNNAPVIDPLAHSRHKPESTGNQCVTCHMPLTTYMQRDPRHDHGFTKPDPLLTKELGIPNACNRCHTDQSVDWAIEHSTAWYGDKLNSRQRQRARVVAAAQAGERDAGAKLAVMIESEDIPAWKATLLLVARPFTATEPRLMTLAREAAKHEDAMVRSAAAQVLSGSAVDDSLLHGLLKDPARLVRLDAAWALSPELADTSPERAELEAYLRVSADQPAGRLRIAQDLFNRGRMNDAEQPLRIAVQWDPNSPGIHESLGLILDATGRSTEAAASLWRAAQLSPQDAQLAFNAALAFAGAGKLPDAELALREALRRDREHHRAWYNLGLLLSQTGRAAEALTALETAERLAPQVADYPYARATLLWQRGDREGAQAAARRTLELDPNHANARSLLQAR